MRQANLSLVGITILSLLATDPETADTMSDCIIESATVKQSHEREKEYGRKIEVVHHGR